MCILTSIVIALPLPSWITLWSAVVFVLCFFFFSKQICFVHNCVKQAETTGHKNEYNSGNRAQLHIKEHGKPLSLLHKDYCLLEKDYSQGGQTSPEIPFNTVFYAPDDWIIPKPGEQGWRHLISHLLRYSTPWMDQSNPGGLRFRNKHASKPSSSPCSTLHKDRHRKETLIYNVNVYLHEKRFTQFEKLFQPTISAFACLQKRDGLRFGDAASECFNDHLGKKYQESTKTKNTHRDDINSVRLASHTLFNKQHAALSTISPPNNTSGRALSPAYGKPMESPWKAHGKHVLTVTLRVCWNNFATSFNADWTIPGKKSKVCSVVCQRSEMQYFSK